MNNNKDVVTLFLSDGKTANEIHKKKFSWSGWLQQRLIQSKISIGRLGFIAKGRTNECVPPLISSCRDDRILFHIHQCFLNVKIASKIREWGSLRSGWSDTVGTINLVQKPVFNSVIQKGIWLIILGWQLTQPKVWEWVIEVTVGDPSKLPLGPYLVTLDFGTFGVDLNGSSVQEASTTGIFSSCLTHSRRL